MFKLLHVKKSGCLVGICTSHHFEIINLPSPGQARQKPTIINTILCLRPSRCQLGPGHYEFVLIV